MERENQMDQLQFWHLIEQVGRESHSDGRRMVRLVEEALRQLPVEEIVTFARMYDTFHARSYSKRLWQSIGAVVGFVSDDSFDYFRAWLISRGEGVFREVTRYPERVSEFLDTQGEWTLEDLNYAAYEAYQQKTGQELWGVKIEAYPLVGYDWLQPDTTGPGEI